MQDNVQDEIRRIGNIHHEIIEAIRAEKEQELDELYEIVLNKDIVALAIKYRNKVKCSKCFMQNSCDKHEYCYDKVIYYLRGVE